MRLSKLYYLNNLLLLLSSSYIIDPCVDFYYSLFVTNRKFHNNNMYTRVMNVLLLNCKTDRLIIKQTRNRTNSTIYAFKQCRVIYTLFIYRPVILGIE